MKVAVEDETETLRKNHQDKLVVQKVLFFEALTLKTSQNRDLQIEELLRDSTKASLCGGLIFCTSKRRTTKSAKHI